MSKYYQELFNREELKLTEKESIDIIVDWKDKNGNYDLRHLVHFIAPDLDLQEFLDIKGLYIGKNILRQEYGFEKNQKPGDFDLIIIPYTDSGIHFERTGVCEVKVVRPTRKKPLKNANSLGITQLNGLINDGFPFVGIVHISLTELLEDEEKLDIDFCTIPANGDEKIEKGEKLSDYFVNVKMDHFQWFSVDKQITRLVSTEIPKYVALMCFGLTKKSDKEYWMETVSRKYLGFETGYFNPNSRKETIKKVRKHFLKNQEKYEKKTIKK